MNGDQDPFPLSVDWLEALDHTADSGLVVRGRDLPELFARAAWGMFTIITDPSRVKPMHEEWLEVEAADLPALLVAWLSELNFHHVTRHLLFSRFEIRDLAVPRLVARVAGEPIDPARHVIHTEIKAVTFHGLELGRTATGWRAQLIFDL